MGFLGKRKDHEEDSIRGHRSMELRALLLASLAFAFGLWLVYHAKKERPTKFAEVRARLEQHRANDGAADQLPDLINLNQARRDDLAPYLTVFDEPVERAFAAEKIAEALQKAPLGNVGAITRIRITAGDLRGAGLDKFRDRLDRARRVAEKRKLEQDQKTIGPANWLRKFLGVGKEPEQVSVVLIDPLGSMKESFIVRSPEEFRNSLVLFAFLFLLGPWAAHFYWRFNKFKGDEVILPNMFALCCFGFLLMVSLRDPLRDTEIFADFARGVFFGSLALGVVTSFDYHRFYYTVLKVKSAHADLLITLVPIGISLILCAALFIGGYGPGQSDAKVNLDIGFTFQPSELVKLLMCFFIAAYFGRRWELIQNLDEKKFRLLTIPRIKDVWVVFVCVALVLGLFFLQKDLGPALLMAGLFLILFAIVRGQALLSALGFLTIIGGYLFNYYVFNISQIAADRFAIWKSPWNPGVRGGEQIVQSFWSLAAGGINGTGLGLGYPRLAPAAHTDLILSSLGEELGFIGLVLIFALYATLLYRCFKIALNASSPYTVFLVLAVAIINALQILFISAGALGVIPLSGVVQPFLSHGSTSMIITFISFGIVLAVSAQAGGSTELRQSFRSSTKYLGRAFVLLAVVILANAAWIQIWKPDEITIRSVLVPQPDEHDEAKGTTTTDLKLFQQNPRIREILNELEQPYGTIYDRKGLPLASNNWTELVAHRGDYDRLGIQLDKVCQKGSRCYPLGSATFFLLGDIRTRKNWGSHNNFIEREYEASLRGFDDHKTFPPIKVKVISVRFDDATGPPVMKPDTKQPETSEIFEWRHIVQRNYVELLPLIRNRYSFDVENYRQRYKPQDAHTSVDAGLQLELTRIMGKALEAKGLKGSAVVLDPQTGNLWASVSYPAPTVPVIPGAGSRETASEDYNPESLKDRAIWENFPPGSTFKIVVEMAALRKNPDADKSVFKCGPVDGGIGAVVRGYTVRDDDSDRSKHSKGHGDIAFEVALTESCNAYFAQLGERVSGIDDTAKLFGIVVGPYIPQSAYGQGSVKASACQIATVAATVSNRGMLPSVECVIQGNNLLRTQAQQIIPLESADIISNAMRGVVIHGTARGAFANFPWQVAGKTGTAEDPRPGNEGRKPIHSWFMGFAPYDKEKRIAFAVIVEGGGYGSTVASDISRDLIREAARSGLIDPAEEP